MNQYTPKVISMDSPIIFTKLKYIFRYSFGRHTEGNPKKSIWHTVCRYNMLETQKETYKIIHDKGFYYQDVGKKSWLN
jgi:hypothetical protein